MTRWFTADAYRDRVAFITGAAGGIGGATARLLDALGCSVALIDIDAEGANGVAADCRDAIAIECDVSDEARVIAASEATMARWGRCDLLVNNAGSVSWSPLLDVAAEDWDRSLAVNLRGYFLCIKHVARHMLERGGAIVNVTSLAASLPETYAGSYSAAKAGQAILTRQCAVELGPFGVRCNAVSPSVIRTPMSEAIWQAPGFTERRLAMTPLRRVGTAPDIASVIAFLGSSAAGFVTGQTIEVDGGWSQTLIDQLPRPNAQPAPPRAPGSDGMCFPI